MKSITATQAEVIQALTGRVLVVKPIKYEIRQVPDDPEMLENYQGAVIYSRFPKSQINEVLSPYCPFGQPGDRVSLRETWALTHPSVDHETGYVDEFEPWRGPIPKDKPASYWYVVYGSDFNEMKQHKDDRFIKRWKPSTQMPSWAIRPAFLDCLVESVVVKPVGEITEEEAALVGTIGIEPGEIFFNFITKWTKRYGKKYPWPDAWAWFCLLKTGGGNESS